MSRFFGYYHPEDTFECPRLRLRLTSSRPRPQTIDSTARTAIRPTPNLPAWCQVLIVEPKEAEAGTG